ncbi:class I SAM-dependent methyltransferase [Dongshaea marina]|uniref:class I SAM-dependent methyltransferase n=1 Tax=Dongshaea marina TaxID=2047966 RepID=UPI000D3EBFF2|nr:class I SAM-dependent methyltransferase [Dongshaea marina]
MQFYNQPDQRSALEAITDAQRIAFAPFAFQATVALVRLGILELISQKGKQGETVCALAEELKISEYGIKVLLDMGLSCRLVWLREDQYYVLDKVGMFLLSDPMTQANLNFSQDVCYQGLFHLMEAIREEKPCGLKVFGDWETIYPALGILPEPARQSWFDFDHYYSDRSFPEALELIFADKPRHILDVGGNTGKWALECVRHDPDVQLTIMDLPEQLALMRDAVKAAGYEGRIDGLEANLLDEGNLFPDELDRVWMSQFLDCFSESQILAILRKVAQKMDRNSRLYIMETFWDRQAFEAAAYSVNATSLYFSCMANGNSRMYHSKDMIHLLHQAGLVVEQDTDNLGAGHTLLRCCLRPEE